MKRGRGMKLKRKSKKAAIEMSFQFIFSIILVAVVLFVGFYVIDMFLKQAEKVKLLQAVEDVRSKINEVSSSDGSSYLIKFKLNSAVDYICFANSSNYRPSTTDGERPPSDLGTMIRNLGTGTENMFFYPIWGTLKYKVNSAFEIYCGSETNKKSCFNVTKAKCFGRDSNGEFSFRIEKPNSESSVYVKAASTIAASQNS
jgi:uncharacterized protein (UPF0333 family)